MEVAVTSHQCEVMDNLCHLATSGQVLVRSWSKVLAVRTILQSSQVDCAQSLSMATSADFPIPWPEDTAMQQGWYLVTGLPRWSRIARITLVCQSRGPEEPSNSPSPQG